MYATKLYKKLVSTSTVCDLTGPLSAVAAGPFRKNALSATSCAKLFSHGNASVYPDKRSFLRSYAGTVSPTECRHYCKDYRPFPEVPEFPPVVWPSLFKSIKALLYTYLIIKPQWDNDFNLTDFSKNSRKAVTVVSNCIAKQDFSTLQGLVTNDVLEQVKSIISNLGDEEIKDMAFNADDMYFFLPVQLDIINDEKLKDRRFVEITMCYHAIHNLEEIKKRSDEIIDIQKELKSSIYVLNYRFIREYTDGVNDAWTINAINHLKAADHDKTIL